MQPSSCICWARKWFCSLGNDLWFVCVVCCVSLRHHEEDAEQISTRNVPSAGKTFSDTRSDSRLKTSHRQRSSIFRSHYITSTSNTRLHPFWLLRKSVERVDDLSLGPSWWILATATHRSSLITDMVLCGGYSGFQSPTPEQKDFLKSDPVTTLLSDAWRLHSVSKGSMTSIEPLQVATQVVAGMNYRVHYRVTTDIDNFDVDAAIFQPLPHTQQGPQLKRFQIRLSEW